MRKAISKKEAIEEVSHGKGRDRTIKILEWIKLPQNARMIVFELRGGAS